jgi:hypothetical protein
MLRPSGGCILAVNLTEVLEKRDHPVHRVLRAFQQRRIDSVQLLKFLSCFAHLFRHTGLNGELRAGAAGGFHLQANELLLGNARPQPSQIIAGDCPYGRLHFLRQGPHPGERFPGRALARF